MFGRWCFFFKIYTFGYQLWCSQKSTSLCENLRDPLRLYGAEQQWSSSSFWLRIWTAWKKTDGAGTKTQNFALGIQVCPKKGINPTILLWGWDWDNQTYSREGYGCLGLLNYASGRPLFLKVNRSFSPKTRPKIPIKTAGSWLGSRYFI